MNLWGYLSGALSLALPLFLLIIAIPYINLWAIFIVGLVSQLGWLISMELVWGKLDKENKKLKEIIKTQ
jgi:acyl-ACP thioesterase